MKNILRGVFNFAIGLIGLFMLVAGADFLGHKWFGESYFAFIGFILIVAVIMWQKSMSDNKQKEKDIKIENDKEKALQSLTECRQTIDALYENGEIKKETYDNLDDLVQKALCNTVSINQGHSYFFSRLR